MGALIEFTPSDIEKTLDNHWNSYQEGISRVAKFVFNKIVAPFLDRRELNFISGNGDWWVAQRGGGNYMNSFNFLYKSPKDEELQEIGRYLNMEIPGSNLCLGEFMPEYIDSRRLDEHTGI